MEYRNAKHTADGQIDCEVDHPDYGWIPYTVGRDDIKGLINGAEMFDAIAATASPYSPPPPPTEAEIAAAKEAADTATMTRLEVGAVERVLLKISFLQENRIRDLEGNAAITLAQFKTWVKAQL